MSISDINIQSLVSTWLHSNDDPIIIRVSDGNTNKNFLGDYYTFKTENDQFIQLDNGNFIFVLGRTYKFIDNGISSSHPFKIYISNDFTEKISGGNNDSIEITIPLTHNPTLGSIYYQCDIHSGMKGNLHIYQGAENISDWDVSAVTNMGSLFSPNRVEGIDENTFQGLKTFNDDISYWNVSAVTDMNNMFAKNDIFNQNISLLKQENAVNSVTVQSTSNDNKYYVNGILTPTLNLRRSETYRFNQSDGSNSSHPIKIYWDDEKNSEYTDGVTYSGTVGNDRYVEITVPNDAPRELHYECENHLGMGGILNIIGWELKSGVDVTDMFYKATNMQQRGYQETPEINNNRFYPLPSAETFTKTIDEDTNFNIIDFLNIDVSASNDANYSGTVNVNFVTNPNNGNIAENIYASNANFNGSDSFEYTREIGGRTSNNGTINITINSVIDNPTVENITTSVLDNSYVIITLNGTSIEGSTLTYTITQDPSKGTLTSITDTNKVTYTPNANSSGSDTFKYKVNDGNDSLEGTVTISITNTNTVPIANDVTIDTNEDTSVLITLNGTDNEGDTLTYTITQNPTYGTLTTITNTNQVTYTPTNNWFGSDSFKYKVNDGKEDSSEGTVTITVKSVDDQSIIKIIRLSDNTSYTTVPNDATIAYEDIEWRWKFTAEDVDNTVTLSVPVKPNWLSFNQATGILSGTPENNNGGNHNITVRATDNYNKQVDLSFTINVNLINDAPISESQTISTIYKEPCKITLSSYDEEGHSLEFDLVNLPSNGILTFDDNSELNEDIKYSLSTITYTPNDNFSAGSDSFIYRIYDELGAVSNDYMITINVSGIFTPSSRTELQNTVDEWYTNETTTRAVYGDINDWDVSKVNDMSNLFKDKTYFNSDISDWNVFNVTDMSGMFEGARTFNQDLSEWNVYNVTNMKFMFKNAEVFDQDISKWFVRSVTNMNSMFSGAKKFNSDISEWYVSNVTDMRLMFFLCEKFDQDLSQKPVEAQGVDAWDVSSVTNMNSMFSGASVFNQNISNWDVSSVTNMNSMFRNASEFDQNLINWNLNGDLLFFEIFYGSGMTYHKKPTPNKVNNKFSIFFKTKSYLVKAINLWISNKNSAIEIYRDINTWDVSEITDMYRLFYNKTKFNEDISKWNVGNVTRMDQMFSYALSFNQPLEQWNVGNVTHMEEMFSFARAFNQPLEQWNVGNVTTMHWMFYNARAFNQPLEQWERTGSTVGNVTNMRSMFNGASAFNKPIGQWNVGNVTNMSDMFEGASAFNQPLEQWERNGSTVGNVTNMRSMFNDASAFNKPIGQWNVGNVTNMSDMFEGASAFNQNLSNWLTKTNTVKNNFETMFVNSGMTFDDTFPYYFKTKDELKTAIDVWINGNTKTYGNINTWDVSDITDMSSLFKDKNTFNSDISNWNVSNVTDMSSMFSGANSFNKSLGSWDVSNIINMSDMFEGASAFNQNLSNWLTKTNTVKNNFETMFVNSGMTFDNTFPYYFKTKDELKTAIDVWINGNTKTYGNINTWDVSDITDMSSLFKDKNTFNSDISNWNVSNVTDMSSMFSGANSFNKSLGSWDVSNVKDMSDMFEGATKMLERGYPVTPDITYFNNNNVFNSRDELLAAVHELVDDKSTAENNYGPINIWNVSQVTDMSFLFSKYGIEEPSPDAKDEEFNKWFDLTKKMEKFNGNISNWDVSSVTNMVSMFSGAEEFNQDISSWAVSSVTNMESMFDGAEEFNQDISSWNVSNVTNMHTMFSNSKKFNQNIGSWDVSKVNNMQSTFYNAELFNQDISNWNTQNVTTMRTMFSGASKFNQNIITKVINKDKSNEYTAWNVSKVTNMEFMFSGASDFNQNLIKWNLNSNVKLSNMFKDSGITYHKRPTPTILGSNFRFGPLNRTVLKNAIDLWIKDNNDAISKYGEINTWDVSQVKDMSQLFEEKNSFNSDISNWNVSNVTSMNSMFKNASEFDQNLINWNLNDDLLFFEIFYGSGMTYHKKPTPNKVNNKFGIFFKTKSYLVKAINLWISNKNSAIETYGDINTWDVSEITDMSTLFANKKTFNSDISNWDVSSVQNMSEMFNGAEDFNQDISSWNVSSVTDMYGMFNGAVLFNKPINTNIVVQSDETTYKAWDVSNVKNMSNMFKNASKFDKSSFNQSLDSWNVSNVTDMSFMFYGTESFNQNIDSWVVSKVTNMDNMFNGASLFNQNISNWNVSSVTNMNDMFKNTSIYNELYGFSVPTPEKEQFNKTLIKTRDQLDSAIDSWIKNKTEATKKYGDIKFWDVRKITDMHKLFLNKKSFNEDINKWDVSSVTNMRLMFGLASSFNKSLNSWDVSSVTDMYYMFYEAKSFNQPLDSWDVSKVTNMAGMFDNAHAFNQPLGQWNVSNVTDMVLMFYDAKNFNKPLNQWNVGNVTYMQSMFQDAHAFNQPLEQWNVGNVTNMRKMFHSADAFNQPLEQWNVGNVTTMEGMFDGASAFNQPLEQWNVGNVTNMQWMFYEARAFNQPLGQWERTGSTVGNVNIMEGMFKKASAFNQPIGQWNVGNVTNMEEMFSDASAFNQPIGQWNVGNVTNMHRMFNYARAFNQPIGQWERTGSTVGNVTDMSEMFYEAYAFNQPLGQWNVGNVTNMGEMFYEASAFNQPIGQWERTGSTVGNVNNMQGMFEGASVFNQPIGKWNVGKVYNMLMMFAHNKVFNQPIGQWNVKNVKNFKKMFYSASAFNQPLGDWNVYRLADMDYMFDEAKKMNKRGYPADPEPEKWKTYDKTKKGKAADGYIKNATGQLINMTTNEIIETFTTDEYGEFILETPSYELTDTYEIKLLPGGIDISTGKVVTNTFTTIFTDIEQSKNVTPITTIVTGLAKKSSNVNQEVIENAKTKTAQIFDIPKEEINDDFIETSNTKIAKKAVEVSTTIDILSSTIENASNDVILTSIINTIDADNSFELTNKESIEKIITNVKTENNIDLDQNLSNNLKEFVSKVNTQINNVEENQSIISVLEDITKTNVASTEIVNEKDFTDANLNIDSVIEEVEKNKETIEFLFSLKDLMNTQNQLNNINILISEIINFEYPSAELSIDIYDIFCLKSHYNDNSINEKSCKIYVLMIQVDDTSIYYSFDFIYNTSNNSYSYNNKSCYVSDIWKGFDETLYENIYSNPTREEISNYTVTRLGEIKLGNTVENGQIVNSQLLDSLNTSYHALHSKGFITRGINMEYAVNSEINLKLTVDKYYNKFTLHLIPESIYQQKILSLINNNNLSDIIKYISENYGKDKLIISNLAFLKSYNGVLFEQYSFDSRINLGVSRINERDASFWTKFGISNKSYSYDELKSPLQTYNYVPLLTFCNDLNEIKSDYSNFNLHIGDTVDISRAVKSLKIEEDPLIIPNKDEVIRSFKIDGFDPNDFLDYNGIRDAIAKQVGLTRLHIKLMSIISGSTVIQFKVVFHVNQKNKIIERLNEIYDEATNVSFRNSLADIIGLERNDIFISIEESYSKKEEVGIKENKKLKVNIVDSNI